MTEGEQRPIKSVCFGVGDAAILFVIGKPDSRAEEDSSVVKSLGLLPSSMPGFYMLIIIFEDDSVKQFMVSPSTIICELGDPLTLRPDIAIARFNSTIAETRI